VIWVPIVLLALIVGALLFLGWYHHPAVRLKRRIRASVQGEAQARQALDNAYRQARSNMHRTARDWRRP
jgi:hypothetical protein